MTLPKTFALYLKTQGFSPVTVKNYLSDLNHFLGWSELSLKGQGFTLNPDDPYSISRHFNTTLVAKYKNYLTNNDLPTNTVNRRLSTLRTFAKFCLSQNWLKENPTKEISNVSLQSSVDSLQPTEKLINEFKKYLEAEKTSTNTIKNYLSDLREFLNFVTVT